MAEDARRAESASQRDPNPDADEAIAPDPDVAAWEADWVASMNGGDPPESAADPPDDDDPPF